jgi:hypothetical protein
VLPGGDHKPALTRPFETCHVANNNRSIVYFFHTPVALSMNGIDLAVSVLRWWTLLVLGTVTVLGIDLKAAADSSL